MHEPDTVLELYVKKIVNIMANRGAAKEELTTVINLMAKYLNVRVDL